MNHKGEKINMCKNEKKKKYIWKCQSSGYKGVGELISNTNTKGKGKGDNIYYVSLKTKTY